MKYILLLLLFCSCQNNTKDKIALLMKEWEDKEIIFPPNSVFTIQGQDTVKYMDSIAEYKIVVYIDSIGCTSCKLHLTEWKKIIDEVDSMGYANVSFLFYFHPKNRTELNFVFRRDAFIYPVCLDDEDFFNKLNHFPSDMAFQTFLLDKKNKVIAIGNPAQNSKIKDLYLKIIRGEELENMNSGNSYKTEVSIDKTSFEFTNFDWQNEQKTTFILKNKGSKPLVIEYVNTSCGCTKVSYSQEPVQPGGEIILDVTYKADHPEHFSKTITVYCNTKLSPIKLTISGNAQ